MTAAARARPPASTLEGAIWVMREQGLRLSTARRLMLEALFAANGPMSAVELDSRLGVDPSSVYRNLDVLEHLGVVRQIHLGRGPGRYLLASGEAHEFLYCERCDKLTALDSYELDPVRDHLSQRFGYEMRFTRFALVGRCPQCAPLLDPGTHPTAPETASYDDRRDPVRSQPRAGAGS